MNSSEINIQIDTNSTSAENNAHAYALQAKEQAELAKSFSLNAPKIGANGNWYVWDVLTEAYVDTNVYAGGGAPSGGVGEGDVDTGELQAYNENHQAKLAAYNANADDKNNAFDDKVNAANDTIDQKVERAEELALNAPKIGANGNWYVWDSTSRVYVDTNVCASGTGGSGDGGTVDANTVAKLNAHDAKLTEHDSTLAEHGTKLEEHGSTLEEHENIRLSREAPLCTRGFPSYDEAILTIIDDDAHINFYTEYLPVYRSHGYFCTVGAVTSRASTPIGTTTSGDPYHSMSWAQLHELKQEGFDIQSHSYSHDRAVFLNGYMGGVTEAQIEHEIGDAHSMFVEHGFDPELMIFPWGAYTPTHLNVAKRYHKYAVNFRGLDGHNYPHSNPIDLNRLGAKKGTDNIAELKAAIDYSIEHKTWLIITTHAFTSSPMQPSAAGLDQLLSYAKSSGIRVLTFHDAVRYKGAAYYAGNGESAFHVHPDGLTSCQLTDKSIERLIKRAYEMGYITLTGNSAISMTATYVGPALNVGDEIDIGDIRVSVEYKDGTIKQTTEFTVDEALIAMAQSNEYTVRFGGLSVSLSISAEPVAGENLLLTYTTTKGTSWEMEKTWVDRRMVAGTYNYRLTMSEAPGDGASSGMLQLKQASSHEDNAGTVLISLDKHASPTVAYTGTMTLTEDTDIFFLYCKLAKKGVVINIYVDGMVADSI